MAVYSDYVAIFGSMNEKQVRDHVRSLAHENAACKAAIEFAIRKAARSRRFIDAFDPKSERHVFYAWALVMWANEKLGNVGSNHVINVKEA